MFSSGFLAVIGAGGAGASAGVSVGEGEGLAARSLLVARKLEAGDAGYAVGGGVSGGGDGGGVEGVLVPEHLGNCD
ncbi:hypothetical protein MMC11_004668 [Xylographa trunciseda]|nr:hypothetical protein [Xylographa trunciseda]